MLSKLPCCCCCCCCEVHQHVALAGVCNQSSRLSNTGRLVTGLQHAPAQQLCVHSQFDTTMHCGDISRFSYSAKWQSSLRSLALPRWRRSTLCFMNVSSVGFYSLHVFDVVQKTFAKLFPLRCVYAPNRFCTCVLLYQVPVFLTKTPMISFYFFSYFLQKARCCFTHTEGYC